MVVAQLTHMARIGAKEYLLTDAQDSFRRGTLLDVVRRFEALLQYDRSDPFTNAELGRTWALLGDEEQATPHYHKAISLYITAGNPVEAFLRQRELLQLLPNTAIDADVLYTLALRLDEVNESSRAIQIFNWIMQFHPDSTEAELALFKKGQLEMNRTDQPDQAVVTLRAFLTKYPTSEWRPFAEQLLESHLNHSAPIAEQPGA
jgi:tetratricopeptide (TPR) repeat protein